MKRFWIWTITVCSLAVVAGLLTWAFIEGRAEMAREREREAPVSSPSRVASGNDGPVIALTEDERTRLGITVAPCPLVSQVPSRVAYGVIEADPSASVTVRAPVAGRIQVDPRSPWPQLGDHRQAGDVAGRVIPRLTVTDLVDLRVRLAAAQAEVATATASLEAARAAAARAHTLNLDHASVSLQSVEDAELRVRSEEARQTTAAATVDIVTTVLGQPTAQEASPVASVFTILLPTGSIAEVLAAPEEIVESGQPLLRVVDYDHLLARVQLPGSDGVGASRATVVRVGDPSSVAATVMAMGAIAPGSLETVLVLRLEKSPAGWRPGQAIMARIDVGGEPVTGVVIPRSAIVRHAGTAWVYVQTDPGHLARRPVSLDQPVDLGWFQPEWGSVSLVVAGAQGLLSEELKSSIQVGEDNAGK
ncbi:MAG: hypothetical protein H0W83_05940 [Planctomycetes bacterium]|nr:hypothetical protein [Planctomycetota bacterium]